MPKFAYKALNQKGETVTDHIEADSAERVEELLAAQGYIPLKVVAGKTGGDENSFAGRFISVFSSVKADELIIVTKQLRSLLMAGVPIIQSFFILQNQVENAKLRNTLAAISIDLKEGLSLSEALRKHGRIFSRLYINMVMAGESTGNIPEILERLVYILEHERKVKADIKAALQYPVIVVAALSIAFFVLLTFVIPKFVTVFEGAGIDIPLPTRVSICLYDFIADTWYLLIAGLIIIIIALVYYVSTNKGRYVRDKILLEVPILGSLFRRSAMARFASIFGMLHASGVHVLDSLEIIKHTIGNEAISREFASIQTLVEEGRGIAQPLRRSRYFTPMVIDMIAIGEETGRLDVMMREVATHYDDEVEYAVKRLSDSIGPILIVALAGVVGFFALAVFLPMWDLTKMVH